MAICGAQPRGDLLCGTFSLGMEWTLLSPGFPQHMGVAKISTPNRAGEDSLLVGPQGQGGVEQRGGPEGSQSWVQVPAPLPWHFLLLKERWQHSPLQGAMETKQDHEDLWPSPTCPGPRGEHIVS